jgi:hypothetical protein
MNHVFIVYNGRRKEENLVKFLFIQIDLRLTSISTTTVVATTISAITVSTT